MEPTCVATFDELSPPNRKRDNINLDYRIFALLLVCATRADLFDEYLADADKDYADRTKCEKLRRLGLPLQLLADSLYLVQDSATQGALQQLQIVSRTL